LGSEISLWGPKSPFGRRGVLGSRSRQRLKLEGEYWVAMVGRKLEGEYWVAMAGSG
jgi:hypothetical protein